MSGCVFAVHLSSWIRPVDCNGLISNLGDLRLPLVTSDMAESDWSLCLDYINEITCLDTCTKSRYDINNY